MKQEEAVISKTFIDIVLSSTEYYGLTKLISQDIKE